MVFDGTRDEKLKDELREKVEENEQLCKKVGQLSIEVDWLKKNLANCLGLAGRTAVLQEQRNSRELPLSTVSRLLSVNRTSAYYKGKPPSDKEIAIKNRIDLMHTNSPTWGARQLSKQLQREGFSIGRRKTRRFMIEMAIYVIYPKPNLSAPNKQHKIYPYPLRNAVIIRPNQAWSIDITYIKLRHGFVYLTAIIDWYSRCVVGWELDDTLETAMVKRALLKDFAVATPNILNSDQGSQFTSNDYISFINERWDVKISMDGVGRWADNIWIERWFRTLKYEEVYIKDYENIKDARCQIGEFISLYNFKRLHSSIGYITSAEMYYPDLLDVKSQEQVR